MAGKIKILFLALYSQDIPNRLRLDQEVREINNKIRVGTYRDSFTLSAEWVISQSDLQQALLEHMPDIVHFTGHGAAKGVSLEDRLGNRKSVTPESLRKIFTTLGDNIRCVVLNSCFSQSQARAIATSVDCVIGVPSSLQFEIAVSFFASFYRALAFGRNIQEAFELGQLQVELEGWHGNNTPKLEVKPDIDPREIYPALFNAIRAHGTKDINASKITIKPPRSLRVFLCHSSGDKKAVRELYSRLRSDGIDPWLDEENLLPGQDWQFEIQKAVRASDIVLACLSQSAINKTGYIQKELKYALDVADEQPEGTIFLIPVRLEECEIPERLRRWQWVNYFDENGYDRLMLALTVRAGIVGLSITHRA